jgi:hypothetical protein
MPLGGSKTKTWEDGGEWWRPWVNLHGQEETEVGVELKLIDLLLKLSKPLRSQVHILQENP